MLKKLSPEQFRHLSVLTDAGFDAINAVTTINAESGTQSLVSVIIDLKKGAALSAALTKAKLITVYEKIILEVAENSGKTSVALNFIATSHELKQQRIKRFKAQLWLPVAVVVIAFLVGTVLSIAKGSSFLASIFSNSFSLAIVWVSTLALLALLRIDILYWLSLGWRLGLQKSVGLYQHYFEYYFYTLLLWQVEAGVDYHTALGKNSKLLNARPYQIKIRNSQKLVESGKSIIHALNQNQLIFSHDFRHILSTGEQSGTLERSMNKVLDIRKTQIELTSDTVYVWLPRLYYVVIVLAILPRFL